MTRVTSGEEASGSRCLEGTGDDEAGDLGGFDSFHPFEDFQFIGFVVIRSAEFRPVEGCQDKAVSNGSPGEEATGTSAGGSILQIQLSKDSLRLFDNARRLEILSEREEDSALLTSCRRVISNHWLFCAKAVYGASGGGAAAERVEARVRLDVYLSASLWRGERHVTFSMKAHVKRLFSRLELMLSPDPQNARADKMLKGMTTGEKKGSILSKVFTNLPRHKDLVSKNFYLGQQSNVLPARGAEPGLWMLPSSALQRIVQSLDSASMGNLAATCRHLHSLCCIQVPGMKLNLYQHQKTALFWMLGREGNQQNVSLRPGALECVTGDGFSFWVDTVNKMVTFEAPDTHLDCRGGFLCDEPGMGKTVTVISLVLRTKSRLPKPPTGCVPIFSCEGSRQGFYEMAKRDTFGIAAVNENVRKTRRSRRGRRSLPKVAASSAGLSSSLAFKPRHTASSAAVSTSTPTQRGESNGGAAATSHQGKATDQPINWVQCDACKKWRVVNQSMNLATDSKWFCKMSSDPELQKNGCSVPEDKASGASDSVAIKSLGYILREESKGRSREKAMKFEEENVQFFISVLKIRKDLWSNVASAVNFLATHDSCQKQLLSGTGLHVPSGRREPEDYGTYFEKLGLVRLRSDTPHSWIQPLWIGGQFGFDHLALSLAISDLMQFKVQVEQIFLSSATLVVVPPHLVPQWRAQFEKCCEDGLVRVYTYDEREKELPPHDLAWNYDVVLTTFSIFSTEWSFRRENSSLMKVHWLRIILDEGHSLGSSLGITNKLQMACHIMAERRWIMTGTPTPDTLAHGAAHLLPLLRFLHEPQYGLQTTMWQPCIQKPLEAGNVEGARSLFQLLSRLMIHAQKSDLESIPKCHREMRSLEFDEFHAKNYNEFVAIVQRNLLLADWWDEAHVESLMHSSKLREMMTVVRNIRLSCNLSGHMMMDVYEEDVRETMMIITQMRPDIDPSKLAWIEGAVRYGAHCEKCQQYCRVPIVTPRCAHILCIDCAGLRSDACSLCGKKYLMEPGQYSTCKKVPVELIELQPSYSQGDRGSGDVFAPNWIKTGTAKSRYILQRLRSVKKAIVFSQFQEHLRMIEDCMPQESVGLYSSSAVLMGKKMRSIRAEAINKFQNDAECRVLLMDGVCSHGLDLSFCSHVIILEPIWGEGLEEQVVSRAHRMGQKREVLVETLAMSGTTEEADLSRGPASLSVEDEDGEASDEELRKSKILLKGLKGVSGVAGARDSEMADDPPHQGITSTGSMPPETLRGSTPASSSRGVVDLAKEVLVSAPNGLSRGKVSEAGDPPPRQDPPPRKRVKFAEVGEGAEDASEDVLLLSSILRHYEETKDLGLKAVESRMIELMADEKRKDIIPRAYFLLTSSYWSSGKAAKNIYLMQKDLHPRYAAPRVFELANELPNWLCGCLRNLLSPVT
ncbi:hypothetical protein A3770_12p66260 [Chloropicon primus]|uniref:F-box protein n=3 Tax=Chloropicon primus TaxID=1764295 RepID=A0A5B8MTJ4_9CHLO|nr:hypothetical protein A3770_12p66260 [Chloropicon primus]|eukprot:QDZ24108.1 hypothetical protein A3770_12p66260 [Chloropicon primus]